MKKFVFLLTMLWLGAMLPTVQAQGKFDPLNPILEDLSPSEQQTWIKKDLAAWKSAMGESVEEWNPIQMEFYKQILILGLSPEDKKKYTAMEFEDWIEKFGGKQPDEWPVSDMLFFSAIQDLRSGL
ncbi:MAG: hypothetical protein ACFCUI_00525 [Bernardetiaceae bacterium]